MFKVIDFFCGCGGASSGLQAAGMSIVAGIDIDPVAIDTYRENFPEAITFNDDINNIKVELLEGIAKTQYPDKLVFAACAPCQPFSAQNRNKKVDDKRACLLDQMHRFIEGLVPDYILLENVPGMQKVKEGPFGRFLKLLSSKGYSVDFGVLDAATYGVPQHRKRLVLIASRNCSIKLPKPKYGPGLIPFKVVRDAIGHYPEIDSGEKSNIIKDHESAKLSPLLKKRIALLKNGEDRRAWPKELQLKCHKDCRTHTDVYGRLDWDKPSVTLTTKCISLSNGRFGHPEQNRAISVREAASIQTFPETYLFKGTLWQRARQVGNAVPPKLAEVIGKEIINIDK